MVIHHEVTLWMHYWLTKSIRPFSATYLCLSGGGRRLGNDWSRHDSPATSFSFSWEFWDVPKPDKIYNPFTIFLAHLTGFLQVECKFNVPGNRRQPYQCTSTDSFMQTHFVSFFPAFCQPLPAAHGHRWGLKHITQFCTPTVEAASICLPTLHSILQSLVNKTPKHYISQLGGDTNLPKPEPKTHFPPCITTKWLVTIPWYSIVHSCRKPCKTPLRDWVLNTCSNILKGVCTTF